MSNIIIAQSSIFYKNLLFLVENLSLWEAEKFKLKNNPKFSIGHSVRAPLSSSDVPGNKPNSLNRKAYFLFLFVYLGPEHY